MSQYKTIPAEQGREIHILHIPTNVVIGRYDKDEEDVAEKRTEELNTLSPDSE